MTSVARQLIRGSALRGLSLLGTTLVTAFMMPFVVRTLGDRLYGFWTLVGTLLGYYGLLDFGLTSAVCQHIAASIGSDDHDRCNVVFNASLRLLSLLGVLALLISIGLASVSHTICRNPDDAALFWKVILVLGLNMALTFPLRAFSGVLSAQLRYETICVLDLLALALRTTLTVWVLLSGRSVLSLALVTVFAGLPSSVLLVHFTRKRYRWLRIRWKDSAKATTRSLLSYSFFTFLNQAADRLRFQADPFIITVFVGLSALTHYRVASLFAEQFILMMISIMGVVQPVFSRLHSLGDQQGIRDAFHFTTRIAVCIATFIGFGIIMWGKPFIARWMGTRFLDAYPPLVILTVATTTALWQTPSVDFLFGVAKHRFYAYANVAEGLINLICSVIFVRRIGIVGVALGTLVAMVLMRLLVQPVWFCRLNDLRTGTYMRLLYSTAGKCLGLASVAFLLCRWGLRPDYRYLIASAVCATVIYGLGSFFAVFGPRDRARFLSVLRPHSQTIGEKLGDLVSRSSAAPIES